MRNIVVHEQNCARIIGKVIIWERETKRAGNEKRFADPMARRGREKDQKKKRSHPADTICSLRQQVYAPVYVPAFL